MLTHWWTLLMLIACKIGNMYLTALNSRVCFRQEVSKMLGWNISSERNRGCVNRESTSITRYIYTVSKNFREAFDFASKRETSQNSELKTQPILALNSELNNRYLTSRNLWYP